MDVLKSSTSPLVGVLVLVLTLGALTACGEAATPVTVPPGDYPDLTLAQSKSPVQLLRNEAVSRISEEVVLNVPSNIDGSQACLTASEDPDGVIRRWTSSVDVNLSLSEAPNTQAIVDGVLETFTDDGWMSHAIAGSKANNQAHLLTNETAGTTSLSLTQLSIEAIVAIDGKSSFIRVQAIGPCVVTDGTDSAEVTELSEL